MSSELLRRLRALQGEARLTHDEPPRSTDAAWAEEAAQLAATVHEAPDGVHFVRSEVRTQPSRHGRAELGHSVVHPWLARWAGGSDMAPKGRVVYLDTETTGLSGGTGTYVFLIGLGEHHPSEFRVDQLVLPGPEHERAWLHALAQRLEGVQTLVSYNGASFDLPLLRTRFAVHGIPDPTEAAVHLDLLPLARRWWSRTLVNCSLGTIEREILGATRSMHDVPGAEVPARYRLYLRTRNASVLDGVISHNVEDIVALTALRTRLEQSFTTVDGANLELGADEAFGIARWLEAIGEEETARGYYLRCAESLSDAAWLLARLERRSGDLASAERWWLHLAERGEARAWVELAKLREHHQRDLAGALEAVAAARSVEGDPGDDLAYRETRLRSKQAAASLRGVD